MQYESRTPSAKGPVNIAKDDFINAIYQFYDSAIDATNPSEGKINANLDFQHYYSPAVTTKIVDETEKLFYAFKKELTKFDQEITGMGLK
jgi:hypothetical protein